MPAAPDAHPHTRENSRRSTATAPDHSSREYSPNAALLSRAKAVAHFPAHSPAIVTAARSRKSATDHADEHSTRAGTVHLPHANDPTLATHYQDGAARAHVPCLPALRPPVQYHAPVSPCHPI